MQQNRTGALQIGIQGINFFRAQNLTSKKILFSLLKRQQNLCKSIMQHSHWTCDLALVQERAFSCNLQTFSRPKNKCYFFASTTSGENFKMVGSVKLFLKLHRCWPPTNQPISQTLYDRWEWLWLSWQSGRFRYQRSSVRILTPANFYRTIIYCQMYYIEKTKIKEKEAGNGPFFRKKNTLGS